MAIGHDFDYARPQELQQALELRVQTPNSYFLAGGTDLIVNIRENMIKPDLLIDIKDISSLNTISNDNTYLSIGAGVTFSAIIDNPSIKKHFPMMWDAAKTVASSGVRNRATLAGNICSAVPSMDSAPPLLCHEAIVVCQSLQGEREIPIEEWFVAPRKTAIHQDEILSRIKLKIPPDTSTGIYVKLGRYGGEDLAQAGWGFYITKDWQYRIAHCALAPIPGRAHLMEKVLNSHALNDALIEEAISLIDKEIKPITDIRSSREYRVHMSSVMLKRGLWAALDRLSGVKVEANKLLGGTA
ncbi:MAG: xanthine dehydrogenase family protein subunit M [Candidatus Cloacimonadaceae bacterium]|nr:xanthine dehydrogenase family protein subunit M [Candidatus Cloacimonadaceae bacterium]